MKFMEEHLDINQALRVYDKVVSKGNKDQDKYRYQDLTAWSDFDGYTVQLSDGAVTLSIYFHNKFEFEYKNAKQLNAFIRKLDAVDRRH